MAREVAKFWPRLLMEGADGAGTGRNGRSRALIAVLASSMACAAPVERFLAANESTSRLIPEPYKA
jgi:hypothetical protein